MGRIKKRSPCFCPEGVGADLSAIWRAAAANQPSVARQTHRIYPTAAGSRQIVSKLDSYALRAESKAISVLLPGGRKSGFIRDLARSGSKSNIRATPDTPYLPQCCRFPAGHQQAGLPRPLGRIKKRSPCFCPEGVGADLSAIWRAAAANQPSGPRQTHRICPSAAGSRQIVSNLDSHAPWAESKAISVLLPGGRRSRFIRDLARSGSKPAIRGMPDTPHQPHCCRFPAGHQQAGPPRPLGRIKSDLRASARRAQERIYPRSGAQRQQISHPWHARHTASAPVLPVPGRSSASSTPTPHGQDQKRSPCFCLEGVGADLSAIWRAAAANQPPGACLTHRTSPSAAGSRQIVSKLDSHAPWAESKAISVLLPGGRRSRFIRDLARSGSKSAIRATPDTPHLPHCCRFPADRQQAGLPRPMGGIKSDLRASARRA
jgi:hypothetical protein